MDPLKGGFVRAPRRGDANEPLTPAEEAAAKIKPPKVCAASKVCKRSQARAHSACSALPAAVN